MFVVMGMFYEGLIDTKLDLFIIVLFMLLIALLLVSLSLNCLVGWLFSINWTLITFSPLLFPIICPSFTYTTLTY